MNPCQPVALDSYVENTTAKTHHNYALFVLVSVGVHLVILFAAYPQLQFFRLPTPQNETNPIFHITLNQELVTPQQPDSGIEESPVSTTSESDTSTPESTPKKVAEIETPNPDITLSEAETNEQPEIAEVAELTEPSQAEQTLESARNLDLDDPEYNGNIFDPRAREKILASRARKPLAQPEPEIQTYQENDGSMLIVDGDTCYKGRELDEFSGTVWSIGYRCPWVKTQSQIMMENVNAAMRARFGRP